MAERAKKAAPVRMAGKTVDLLDASFQGTGLAEDPDLGRPGDDQAAERAGGLITDEQDGGFGPGNIVDEMMLDPAARAHARTGHDNGWTSQAIEGPGLLLGPDVAESGELKRRLAGSEEAGRPPGHAFRGG